MKITTKQYAIRLYEATKDVEKGALVKSVRAFIELLAKNRALNLLPKITNSYQSYYNAKEDVMDVTITTARPLPPSSVKHLKEALRDYNAECASQIDPTVLGGAKIRAGDYMLDDTLKTRIMKLKESLYAR